MKALFHRMLSFLCALLAVLGNFAGVAFAGSLAFATGKQAQISRNTCPYSCQNQGIRPQGAQPSEVFGKSSRCFAIRMKNTDAMVYQCYRVLCEDASCKDTVDWTGEKGLTCSDWQGFDCSSAVSQWGYSESGMTSLLENCRSSCGRCTYNVQVSKRNGETHGATATCKEAGSWITFAGWTGELRCDHNEMVCSGDAVIRAPDEERRDNISAYLHSQFDASAADELMGAYDRGKFNPHTQDEGGISGAYIVDKSTSGCDWAQTSLKHLETVELQNLGVTLFTGVGQTELLDAVNQECAKRVEQGITLASNSYFETSRATWGIDSLDGVMDQLYRRYYSGKGVRVYVLDTGIDASHVELQGRVLTGVDYTNSPIGTKDKKGHGTHCAGTIAGKTVGVAPEAEVLPVKVLGDSGSSVGHSVMQGIDFVLKQHKAHGGPAVVSASLGGSRADVLNQAYKKMVDAGITVVVAAGNENRDAIKISPASEPSLITVGAIDRSMKPASFSNFGRILDIWAPGVDITSAKAGGGLTQMDGTSMACPHVAGVAALLLEKHPDWTCDKVRDAMVGDCRKDQYRLKRSTGLVLRTWAGPAPDGNKSSPCILAFDGRDAGADGSDFPWLQLVIVVVLVCILLCLCIFHRQIRGVFERWMHKRNVPQAVVPLGSGSVTQVQLAPSTRNSKTDIVPTSLETLHGSKWESFRRTHEDLAKDIQRCDQCLSDPRQFENSLEDVWNSLRKNIRKASSDGSLAEVRGKEQVWYFILVVAARRKFYVNQVKEVANLLDESAPWKKVVSKDSQLRRLKSELLK